MTKADFLFELGCEELPSAAVLTLSQALTQSMTQILSKEGLVYDSINSFATPRRLAFRVNGLVSQQPTQTISRRGPAFSAAYDSSGNPTQALLGFAKSCGVAPTELSTVKTDKGDWIFYEAQSSGVPTIDLLPKLIKAAITELPIAKPMRWGDGNDEFARPVHWVVMLFGDKLIAAKILGIDSDQISYGHRFHHPESIHITTPADYESLLMNAQVVVDFNKRREMIREQVQNRANQLNARPIIPDALLDEVTSIVEQPVALLVPFDKSFLSIPQEVLIASMQSHQKCFALGDEYGKLFPYFITISNLESKSPQQVIAGNEKVMRARLSDAAFFFAQDRKNSLASLIPLTMKVIFQEKLGSLYDKSQRMKKLIQLLIEPLQLNEQEASRATELSKCDLMTGMVGEFPELQGLMGYYYAKQDSEPLAVAVSLNDQYKPRFAGDDLPVSPLGSALSLVDRLDTLVGAFLLGEKPSGVRDPFKLRRHALAVARLLINNRVALSLSVLIHAAEANYYGKLAFEKSLIHELQPFILERLDAYYHDQQISSDLVSAVRVRQSDCLYDFDRRVQALSDFVKLPEAAVLSAVCKRVNNLLNSVASNFSETLFIDERLFQEKAEKELFNSLDAVTTQVDSLNQAGNYPAILNLLPSLRDAIDVFFEQVMVLVDDERVKVNRLALLKRLQVLLQCVADISLCT